TARRSRARSTGRRATSASPSIPRSTAPPAISFRFACWARCRFPTDGAPRALSERLIRPGRRSSVSTRVISSRVIIAVSLIGAVTPARAQPAASQAEELYNKGRALVAANKIVEACDAFEQSQKLDPALTTLIALATCRERQGLLATSLGV